MSLWKKFLSKIGLSFPNEAEELEYSKFRSPLIKDLCIWLFVFIALLFIPLIYRYISKSLYPQVQLGSTFLVLAIIIFIFRRKLQKYLEFISVIYLALILGLYMANMKLILGFQKPYEAFYMGYGFALIQRMLDYRISKFPIFIFFNLLFTILKFTIVTIPEGGLGSLVVCLEVFPMIISFKVEKAERKLFDSFQKSKSQLLKFQDFLTDYFPNQMIVLSQNYSDLFFANSSFKSFFKCRDFSALKSSLEKLEISNDSIDQNRELFTIIEQRISNYGETRNSLNLSRFLELICDKIKETNNSKPILLQVYQSEEKDIESFQRNEYLKNHPYTQSHEDHSSLLITDKPSNNQRLFKNVASEDGDQQSPPKQIIWKATIFPLLWDENEAFAIIFDDVTYERTIMELEIADKNKDLVIAMVSHELRTPLNGMLGMLDIVRKRLKLVHVETEVFYYLDAFRINSQFLLNLVNSILDFSQYKNNKLTLDYTQVHIHKLLEKIKPLFDQYCKAKNLFLDIQIDQDVPETIVTDQGRLSQILINLIGNAFKFTFTGGVTVRVTLEQQQHPCRIGLSVHDTGIGIQKENMDKLFQLFGRLEQHKEINTQGVGLGLILSNTLARLLDLKNQHRGIQVMSEVGKGTLFKFTIESKSITQESDDAESSIDEQQQGSLCIQDKLDSYHHDIIDKKNKIPSSLPKEISPIDEAEENAIKSETQEWCLLVDDNPFNLIIAEHLMEGRGYKIKKALNGKEAIERVQEHEREGFVFRIILMDCEMPVMNGYEATKILTKMMREREVNECPIVAVTANMNDERHKKLCEEVGMSGYIAKPLQTDKVEQVLKRF